MGKEPWWHHSFVKCSFAVLGVNFLCPLQSSEKLSKCIMQFNLAANKLAVCGPLMVKYTIILFPIYMYKIFG